MKKLFIIITVLAIAFAINNDLSDTVIAVEEEIEPLMSIEEAHEKIFRLLNENETFCWETKNIPLELLEDINEALMSTTCFDDKVEVRVAERLTNLEFYQMMKDEYLANLPNAMSSKQIQELSEKAKLAPNDIVSVILIPIPE